MNGTCVGEGVNRRGLERGRGGDVLGLSSHMAGRVIEKHDGCALWAGRAQRIGSYRVNMDAMSAINRECSIL